MVVRVADADVPCQAPELPWSTIAVRVRAHIIRGSSAAGLIPAEFGLGIGARKADHFTVNWINHMEVTRIGRK